MPGHESHRGGSDSTVTNPFRDQTAEMTLVSRARITTVRRKQSAHKMSAPLCFIDQDVKHRGIMPEDQKPFGVQWVLNILGSGTGLIVYMSLP